MRLGAGVVGKTENIREVDFIVHKLLVLSQDQKERPKRMILRFSSHYLYLGCGYSQTL